MSSNLSIFRLSSDRLRASQQQRLFFILRGGRGPTTASATARATHTRTRGVSHARDVPRHLAADPGPPETSAGSVERSPLPSAVVDRVAIAGGGVVVARHPSRVRDPRVALADRRPARRDGVLRRPLSGGRRRKEQPQRELTAANLAQQRTQPFQARMPRERQGWRTPGPAVGTRRRGVRPVRQPRPRRGRVRGSSRPSPPRERRRRRRARRGALHVRAPDSPSALFPKPSRRGGARAANAAEAEEAARKAKERTRSARLSSARSTSSTATSPTAADPSRSVVSIRTRSNRAERSNRRRRKRNNSPRARRGGGGGGGGQGAETQTSSAPGRIVGGLGRRARVGGVGIGDGAGEGTRTVGGGGVARRGPGRTGPGRDADAGGGGGGAPRSRRGCGGGDGGERRPERVRGGVVVEVGPGFVLGVQVGPGFVLGVVAVRAFVSPAPSDAPPRVAFASPRDGSRVRRT